MTLVQLLLIAAGTIAVSLLLAAAAYWLSARLWRVRLSFGRCMAIVLISTAPLVLLAAAVVVFRPSAEPLEIAWIVTAVVGIVTAIVAIKRLVRISWPRALGIWLVANLLATPVSYGLAFALRANFVESFVLAGGSMAPTLYGEHVPLTCPNCGHSFALGATRFVEGPFRPTTAPSARCLNCRHEWQISSSIENVKVQGGERILVDKTAPVPNRWELATFFVPGEDGVVYVKRTIGLPSETVALRAGEVFIDGELLVKPPGELESLWMPVHDTGLTPRDEVPDAPRWAPAEANNGWSQSDAGWQYDRSKSAAELRYSGPITDAMQYNSEVAENWGGPQGERSARDVKVACRVAEIAAGAELELTWTWQDHTATFVVSSTGQLDIDVRSRGNRRPAHGEFEPARLAGEPLSLAIRDNRAYAMIGGDVIAATEIDSKAREHLAASADKSCDLTLAARGAPVRLGRIELLTDVYYIAPQQLGGQSLHNGGEPVTLASDEYWLLGDNSAASMDSRFWGSVSSDKITGVARWLYWPLERMRSLP